MSAKHSWDEEHFVSMVQQRVSECAHCVSKFGTLPVHVDLLHCVEDESLAKSCFFGTLPASEQGERLTVSPLIVCADVAEESARFRLARMHEKLSQLERKMVNVEARLSLHDSSLPDIASVG